MIARKTLKFPICSAVVLGQRNTLLILVVLLQELALPVLCLATTISGTLTNGKKRFTVT